MTPEEIKRLAIKYRKISEMIFKDLQELAEYRNQEDFSLHKFPDSAESLSRKSIDYLADARSATRSAYGFLKQMGEEAEKTIEQKSYRPRSRRRR